MVKKEIREEHKSPFDTYLDSIQEQEKADITAFFKELDSHVKLPKKEKSLFYCDFQKALIYYHENGISLDEALKRLSVKNLGGFYARPSVQWYALDDAAKIYPLSLKYGQMAVFRLSVYLKENVIPELLQIALSFVIKRFPSFATTVKKGFFWHYLDTTKRRFNIEPDSGLPCRPLKIANSGSKAFRVMYYNNRISIEFFHILTDGTGGMIFLKTLIAEYFHLLGIVAASSIGILNINDVSDSEETANEFLHAKKASTGNGFFDKPALAMSGKLTRDKPYRVLHFKMSTNVLKQAANKYNATVTAYILATMFLAGRFATEEQRGEISIQVPVNMRKFYPSRTVRNFSMYCGIRLPINSVTSKEEIIPKITSQLTDKASIESMSQMMSSTEKMVASIRNIPLFIKAPVAKIVYGFLGDKIFSNTLSNIGVVKMPEELSAHIDSMDFVLGTALTNRCSCSLVTINDIATLSITKMTADPSFEERLLELLSEDGIDITVEGSFTNED